MKNKYVRLCCCILVFIILCVVLLFVVKEQDNKEAQKESKMDEISFQEMEQESEVIDDVPSDSSIQDGTSDLTDETIIVESNDSNEKTTQEALPEKETISKDEMVDEDEVVDENEESEETTDREWSRDY